MPEIVKEVLSEYRYPFELNLVDTSHAAGAPFNVTIPETGKITKLFA